MGAALPYSARIHVAQQIGDQGIERCLRVSASETREPSCDEVQRVERRITTAEAHQLEGPATVRPTNAGIRRFSVQRFEFREYGTEKILAGLSILYKITVIDPAERLGGPKPGARAMRELTPRQLEILGLIRRHLATTGFPPTRAEIATELGFRSANAAEEHLKALARKGVIELTSGASRGIRLVPRSPAALPAVQNSARAAGDRRSRAANLLDTALQAVQGSLTLPLVGRVSAGSPILAQEHVEASYAIDPELFSARPDYLLKVRGLSMRDAGILDGDLLAVKQASEARNGQIVVARIGNDVTVKRFRRHGAGGRIELLPENPDFQPIVVDARSEDFALEGIGVGLIRKTASL